MAANTMHLPFALRPVLASMLLLLLLTGCARFNCTQLERYIGGETDLIAFSYTIADELTASAFPPLMPRNPDMPLLVTTFVDNNDLTRTSKFGRAMQEHISSRLVQLGYTVKEIKFTGNLLIEPRSGESILSRDLRKLSASIKSQGILVGTISYTNRVMYVSARFVNPVDRTIISSSDYRLCMDDNILAMFGLQREDNSSELEEPRRPFLNSILY
jgi:TolB-like protein